MKTTITFTNNNPNTIWNRLATTLGRQPTDDEASAEVKRILKSGDTKNAAQECDPDCEERIACPLAGTVGHSDCGLRPCGCARHHLCSCKTEPITTLGDRAGTECVC